MAKIRFLKSKEYIYVREHHTFGRRSDSVDTLLDYPYVSRVHVVMEWRRANWVIRDVSSNGVWLNDARIPSHERIEVHPGDVIKVNNDDSAGFEIVNIEPPVNMIYQNSDSDAVIRLVNEALIPSEEAPKVGIYKCPDRGNWYSEEIVSQTSDYADLHDEKIEPHETGPYVHGDTVLCGDDAWTLFLVNEDEATVEFDRNPAKASDVEFRFDLSQDEESTTACLIHEGREIDLGERSHHYLLVHLLRHKVEQQKHSTNQTSSELSACGWVNCSLVTKELGIDEAHMNIQIFRARKQLTEALENFVGKSRIIERRRGSIRIGIDKFSIHKEGVREA